MIKIATNTGARLLAVLAAYALTAGTVAAQNVCETPTPGGITQCLDSPLFSTDVDYRFNTQLWIALGTEYFQSQAWIDANVAYITDKIDLTNKTGLELSEDHHYRHLFTRALTTALTVSEPFDIYLLMGQSNMYLHGQGTEFKAAIQSFTDAVTQTMGGGDRTVVTINCAVSGVPILWWDPEPSPLFGGDTCETVASVARCADPNHDPSSCDPANPELCTCQVRELDFCSDGVSLVHAEVLAPYSPSPFLSGEAIDRHNLTRHCLEYAQNLRNTAGERGVIKGMVYHQGESDGGSASLVSTWGDSYQNVVAHVRQAVGSDIPAVHAQIRAGASPSQTYLDLQVEQREVVADITNSAYVCTNDLTVAQDGVHIDRAGHVLLGQRYASAILHLFFGLPYNADIPECDPT